MKKRLLDNWSISGNDLNQFKKEVRNLANTTGIVRSCAKDVMLLSKNPNRSETDALNVFVLQPNQIWEKTLAGSLELKQGRISNKKIIEEGAADLIKEYENNTKLLVHLEGKLYFTSSNLSTTMGLRSGLKGDASLVPCVERDILTAQRLNNDSEVSFIIRNVDGVKKIFAALSGKYTYVPQSFLCDVIERVEKDGKLGKIDCKHWKIDNELAEIFLEFPERANEISTLYEFKDEMVPGLYLAKSDVGECSITVRSTWRINNSIIIQDEIKRKHSAKIKPDEVLEDIDKVVFAKYTQLPDLLSSLMLINITDPEWVKKLSTQRFIKTNEQHIQNTIKKVFNKIGLVDAICKKNEKQIYDSLCDEIDASLSYTAYDIVMMIMQIPERVHGLASVYRDPLAKACGKAPFVKFEKEETKKVILTA